MYGWTKDYCLDELSLSQWIKFYQKGWDARQTESRVNWGILGMLLNGDSGENLQDTKNSPFDEPLSLEEVQRYYPDAYFDQVSRKIVIPK
ncbi:MAG: hypothetical protein PHW84_01855 [Methanosarcina sp.]|nr:hypothetical protein [Methanosarcina sp.]